MLSAVLIGNERLVQDVLIEVISSLGVAVKACILDEYDVVKKVLEQEPDIVFIDVIINNFDGLLIGKKIKDANEKINIVFIADDGTYAPEAFNLCATDYLLKPINKERIAVTLKRISKE